MVFVFGNVVLGAVPVIPEQRPVDDRIKPETPLEDSDVLKDSPPQASQKKSTSIPGAIRFTLKAVTIVGARRIPKNELLSHVEPFINKPVDSIDLINIKNTLTRVYIDRGYINSGALLPDQKITDGEVEYRIIEGKLNEVEISGQQSLSDRYINERIRYQTEDILNINVLRTNLKYLQLNPAIKAIHADLIPGTKPGESRLLLALKESTRNKMTITLDNAISPDIGEEHAGLSLFRRNTMISGDSFEFKVDKTLGLEAVQVSTAFPLHAGNSKLHLNYSLSKASIIEDDLDFDIDSEFNRLSVGVRVPLNRNLRMPMTLGLEWVDKEVETVFKVEDLPALRGIFAQSEVAAARLVYELNRYTAKSTWSWRLKGTVGKNKSVAATNNGSPQGAYNALLNQFVALFTSADRRRQGLLRLDAQLTNDTLVPSEQFSIGGMYSVRGYRENLLLGDRGFIVSGEYRYMAGLNVWINAFADYGRADNVKESLFSEDEIYSAGVGLQWQLIPGIKVNLNYAYPLVNIDDSADSWQEQGIHVQFVSEMKF